MSLQFTPIPAELCNFFLPSPEGSVSFQNWLILTIYITRTRPSCHWSVHSIIYASSSFWELHGCFSAIPLLSKGNCSQDSTNEEPSSICNGSHVLLIRSKAVVFCDISMWFLFCCMRQIRPNPSKLPSRPDLVVSMNHKQDNDRLLIDERSGQSSQSPPKYSVGNTGEPEKDTHFNPPPPSPWKRAALIVLICFLFYLGFSVRSTLLSDKKHDIVYAFR